MAAVISRQSLLLFVARIFRIRRSEMSRVIRMSSLAVVLGWGMYCAFNATQSIFLVQSGPEAYPLFFILLALSALTCIPAARISKARLPIASSCPASLAIISCGTWRSWKSTSPPASALGSQQTAPIPTMIRCWQSRPLQRWQSESEPVEADTRKPVW